MNRRKLKKKLVRLGWRLLSPDHVLWERSDLDQAYREIKLPHTFTSDKRLIIKRVILLALIILLTIWGWLSTSGFSQLGIFIIGSGLIMRYADYLYSVFRLFDSVKLTSSGLIIRSLLTQKYIPWHSVSEVSLKVRFFDGLLYIVKQKDGTSAAFSDKITKHYLIYHYITQHISTQISD